MGEAVSTQNQSGCLGCVGVIIACLALWALLFGVTVGGEHYGLSGCDTEGGLKFK